MLVMAAGSYGFIGFLNKVLANNGYNSIDVAFIRNIVPLLPLLIIILSVEINALKIRIKDLWIFAGAGILKVAADVCLFKAMMVISISVACVLEQTSAIFV